MQSMCEMHFRDQLWFRIQKLAVLKARNLALEQIWRECAVQILDQVQCKISHQLDNDQVK